MKNNTLLSLSIQREIEKHPLNVESDIATSMARLGFQTLLNRSGICKQKGCPPFSLLFALLLVPFLKETVRALWVNRHCSRLLGAQKDTVYRFLNHYGFNWRKLILLLINRVLTRIDSSPFNDRVLIVDDSVLPKTGKEMELVSFHHDHKTNRSQPGLSNAPTRVSQQNPLFPGGCGLSHIQEPHKHHRAFTRQTVQWVEAACGDLSQKARCIARNAAAVLQ